MEIALIANSDPHTRHLDRKDVAHRIDNEQRGRKMKIAAVVFIALLMVPSGSAWAEGDARTGFWLTRHWCGSCHGLGTGVASDAAPSLDSIARRAQREGWIRAWLADPHPPMPNFTLSRSEIDDIIAYLNVLKGR